MNECIKISIPLSDKKFKLKYEITLITYQLGKDFQ